MKPLAPLAAGLVLCLVAAPVHAAAVGEVVQRVQDRFDATQDLSANVEQELVVASAGKTVRAKGTVAFKRPGKMRWQLTNGDTQIIVADGATLWFYQPDEQQVLTAPFRAAFRSSTPVSFLTGVGKLSDDFDVQLDGEDSAGIHLALRARKADGELGRLRLTVNPETYDIVGAEIVDPLGNVTRLRFSDLRRNTGVDDSQFKFQVPPGVDVIEAPIGN